MLKQGFSGVQASTLASGQAVQNPESQMGKPNPPVPPQAEVLAKTLALDPVPLAVRRQRVLNGSKRKRDLAAVQMANELERLEAAGQVTADVTAAWDAAREAIRASVPESTFQIWIEPLHLAGVFDGAILLAADEPRVTAWARRRYSGLIAEALRHVSEFERAEFVGIPA